MEKDEEDHYMTIVQIRDEARRIIAAGQHINEDGEEKWVEFDFPFAVFTNFSGYFRGCHEQIYAEYRLDGKEGIPVTKFLEEVENAIKQTEGFEYSYGESENYASNPNTPIWVAQDGCTGQTAISGIVVDRYEVVLRTRYMKNNCAKYR